MGRGADGAAVTRRRSAAAAGAAGPFPPSLLPAGCARVPAAPPPFTLASLRAAVPPHCFRRSALRSFAYLARDLALAACVLAVLLAARRVAPPAALLPLWLAYAVVQGTVMTGVWVVAHECGHGAFSASPLLNDVVGCVLHSSLLVPFWSWKFSHARHHGGTGSLSRDEVFVPDAVCVAAAKPAWLLDSFAGRALLLFVALVFGWPAYLAANASSPKYDGSKTRVNHFSPWSPIFHGQREAALVVLSDAALCAVVYGLYCLASATSLSFFIGIYAAPLLVVNFWLVLITLQQHTHASLPHFDDKTWNWLHGACSTVDRDNGWLLNTLHHHIADTHVCHHIFSQIPHYHAVEATACLRSVMGQYAVKDSRPTFRALWSDWCSCVAVQPEGGNAGVLWFCGPKARD